MRLRMLQQTGNPLAAAVPVAMATQPATFQAVLPADDVVEDPRIKHYPRNGHWAVVWQVHDSGKWWIDYSPEFCHKFEDALQSGNYVVTGKPGDAITYSYNVKTQTQQNTETNGCRTMRRTLVPADHIADIEAKIEELQKYNEKHKDLRASWQRTGKGPKPRAKSQPRSKSQSRGKEWSGWEDRSDWWQSAAAAGWKDAGTSASSKQWTASTGVPGHNSSSQL